MPSNNGKKKDGSIPGFHLPGKEELSLTEQAVIETAEDNPIPLEAGNELKPTVPPKEDRIDYRSYRISSQETWEEYYDDDLSLAENFINIVNQSVLMPDAAIQVPIATAYALIPSALANIIPILFLQGAKGSGKSTLGILIAALREQVHEIKSAATTFAALRNHLNRARWHDPETHTLERNCILIWDDISQETLGNPQIYSLFKSGYNRKTEVIEIASGEPGQNLQFRTFSAKVVSSVRPFYAESRYSELNRRCLVLKFKAWETMTPSEKGQTLSSISERLDPDSVDWSGFGSKYDEFWKRTENLEHYSNLKREVMKRKKSFKIPDIVTSERWTISTELLCSGVVTGVWDSLTSGVQALATYWEWYERNLVSGIGAIHKVLKIFIDAQVNRINHENEKMGCDYEPLEIRPETLKKYIWEASGKGELDVMATPGNIAVAMADLGWRLDKNSFGDMAWMPIAR